MSDLDDEIRQLRERTAENRRQFLLTEVQTCFITLDVGKYSLASGNIEMARKEYSVAARGIATIEHFLSEAPDQGRELEPKLAALRALLVSLGSELDLPG